MMFSPETFINMIEDKSYENLVKERDKLIREIHEFETGTNADPLIMMKPSPDVIYQCNNLYLIEITKLLNETFRNNENSFLNNDER